MSRRDQERCNQTGDDTFERCSMLFEATKECGTGAHIKMADRIGTETQLRAKLES